MGTRADFYVGYGLDAEWLGSVAWDGYEWAESPDNLISAATSEAAYRVAVTAMLKDREDATLPHQGWPWPWNSSHLTDYVYYFSDGKVRWDRKEPWPDMAARKKVAFDVKRSGVFIVG